MKILTTSQWGSPDEWPIPQAILLEAVWEQAEKTYNEDLFTSDMRYTNGREVKCIDVMLACPNVSGPVFCNTILMLLNRGILEVKEPLDWDILILTRAFIDAQQEARHLQVLRTNRLADILLTANRTYQHTIARLGISQSYEHQVRVQRSIGVMQARMLMLTNRANRWKQSKLIDSGLWEERIVNALLQIKNSIPEHLCVS